MTEGQIKAVMHRLHCTREAAEWALREAEKALGGPATDLDKALQAIDLPYHTRAYRDAPRGGINSLKTLQKVLRDFRQEQKAKGGVTS